MSKNLTLNSAQITCNNGAGRFVYERLPDQQLQGFDDEVVSHIQLTSLYVTTSFALKLQNYSSKDKGLVTTVPCTREMSRSLSTGPNGHQQSRANVLEFWFPTGQQNSFLQWRGRIWREHLLPKRWTSTTRGHWQSYDGT